MFRYHQSTLPRFPSQVMLPGSPASRFCRFLDDLGVSERLDGSLDAILLVPRLFILFVWANREELLRPVSARALGADLPPQEALDAADAADAADAGGGGSSAPPTTTVVSGEETGSDSTTAASTAATAPAPSGSTRPKLHGPVAPSPLSKLIIELHPQLLQKLFDLFAGSEWDTESEAGIKRIADEGILVRGVDSSNPSGLSKQLEVLSMELQRLHASTWNSFCGIVLHEEELEEEKQARPRLPSV